MTIGVLALQGDFQEHCVMLHSLGVATREVRLPEHLTGLAGLIVPGGESTTIGKIARAYDLIEPIRALALAGLPVWGTCAGMILLAQDIGGEPPYLGLMPISVKRNAFGRQIASFEADLEVPALAELGSAVTVRSYHAVFIRAPLIAAVGVGVDPLARLADGTIVAARMGNLLVTSFHPELTPDTRFHALFVTSTEGMPFG
jgi:5'-phosphate synthase pdxT subunit